jgi:hypothetical protein
MSNPPAQGTHKRRMILWIIAVIVAFFTWGLSPIEPLFVLIVFAFILVAILTSVRAILNGSVSIYLGGSYLSLL